MDQMEENEIELETVVIDSNKESDSLILASTEETSPSVEETNKVEKLARIPVTRVKQIVKMDPDVSLCSKEALFLIAKTTVHIF